MKLPATLAQHPDAERIRLRLGTAFVEHVDDLWPEGGAPDREWIRCNVEQLLAMELMLRHDRRDVRRLPHRLHWLLWLLADLGMDAWPTG
jgi:hypothetical protein